MNRSEGVKQNKPTSTERTRLRVRTPESQRNSHLTHFHLKFVAKRGSVFNSLQGIHLHEGYNDSHVDGWALREVHESGN